MSIVATGWAYSIELPINARARYGELESGARGELEHPRLFDFSAAETLSWSHLADMRRALVETQNRQSKPALERIAVIDTRDENVTAADPVLAEPECCTSRIDPSQRLI